jgi:hypothetical protein
MGVHGVRADALVLRDLLTAQTARDEAEDVRLTARDSSRT